MILIKYLICSILIKYPKNIRFFLGYSGWSKNQLVKEIAENAWIVSEFDSSKVISLNDNLWQSVLSDKGGRYKIVSNCPKDPSSNWTQPTLFLCLTTQLFFLIAYCSIFYFENLLPTLLL